MNPRWREEEKWPFFFFWNHYIWQSWLPCSCYCSIIPSSPLPDCPSHCVPDDIVIAWPLHLHCQLRVIRQDQMCGVKRFESLVSRPCKHSVTVQTVVWNCGHKTSQGKEVCFTWCCIWSYRTDIPRSVTEHSTVHKIEMHYHFLKDPNSHYDLHLSHWLGIKFKNTFPSLILT